MSLSKAPEKPLTGRVLLGMDTPGPGEMTLQEMEGKRRLIWDETMDLEFMDRVRAKAKDKAKEIIAQAMKEARQIRAEAHEEGLRQGTSEGEAQLARQLSDISAGLGQVIGSIQDQAEQVWAARGNDFVRLIRMAVEKTIGMEMAERRRDMLHGLLEEAVQRIESERRFVIRTNPADVELIEELLRLAQAEHPKLSKWLVKADPSITAGVVVETADAKAENTTDQRWEDVSALLDQLAVPSPAGEESGPEAAAPPSEDA